MSTRPQHALIIGGGVAGPALGVFLKRAGITSAVYEAYPQTQGIGGGLGFGPNGMNVLAALGVDQELKAHSARIESYRFRNERGSQLAAFDLDAEARFGQPMLGLTRAGIADAVGREAHRQRVPINYQKRLVGIEQDTEAVVAHFDDGSSAKGDLLIGADGVNSATRRLALPGSPDPSFTGMVGIGGLVDAATLAALTPRDLTTMTFTFGSKGFFGYCGGGDGQAMWWTNLPRKAPLSRTEQLEIASDVLKRELLQQFGTYHQPIPQLVAATTSILQLNIFDIQSLPTWHAGRVLVVGDAAHAVSPSAGQGASLALEDAMLLAKLLRDSPDYQIAFEDFERQRKPRVERIVAEGRRRGVDKQLVSPMQAKMRELMMRLMLNLFGKHADDWVWRYRIDWQAAPKQLRPEAAAA